ncbi:MAG TPA: DUF1707 domain-containing protein [Nocardioides sp.]|nr:DUF1707 domain-containing protein [Nocardioides sp.]
MIDPEQLRVSDDDRHRVAEVLREAAGEGRIDLEELDQRLEAAYAAKVYADLVPILADLPGSHLPAVSGTAAPVARVSGPTSPARRFDSSFAMMGGQDRKGVWEIGAEHRAFTLMGGIDLDLREAVFGADEVVIHAVAIMGGIDIYVNASTKVSVEGVGIMGAFDQARDKVEPQLGPDSPTVRVKGLALMAGVTVKRRPMPGEERRKRLPG